MSSRKLRDRIVPSLKDDQRAGSSRSKHKIMKINLVIICVFCIETVDITICGGDGDNSGIKVVNQLRTCVDQSKELIFGKAVSTQQLAIRPRLNVSAPYLLINAGDTWSLLCNGTRDVGWIFPKKAKNRTSHHDKVYESTLTVTASKYVDTGRYVCYYLSSSKDNETSSVYVYISDERQLLLPVPRRVKLRQSDPEATLPCRPTHPKANVTFIGHKPNMKQVKFDPERGWLIRSPNREDYYNQKFTCKATLGSLSSNVTFKTRWKADTRFVQPPTVSRKDPEKVILPGQLFQLNSTMLLENSISFEWEWIHPNSTPIKERPYTTYKTINSTFDRWFGVLEVSHAVVEDTGNYTCEVTLDNGKMLQSSIFVQVTPRSMPFLINTTLKGNLMKTQQAEDIEMVCLFAGQPPPNITWYKDGELISSKMPGFSILDNDSKLKILRVKEVDGGDYFCKAENMQGTAYANMTLQVEARVSAMQASIHTDGLIALGIASVLIFVILSAVLLKFVFSERKQRRDLAVLQKMLFDEGDVVSIDPDAPLMDQVELLPYDRKWEIPRDKIKLGRPLGQGAFGRVVKAQVYGFLEDKDKPLIVAVKLMKERAELSHHKALLQELKMLIHLGRHPNILNLLGACTTNLHKGVMVLVEYCSQGSLCHFLLNHRDVFVNQVDPKTGNIVANACFACHEDTSGVRYQNVSTFNSSTAFDQTVDTTMNNLSQEEQEQQPQISDDSRSAYFTSERNCCKCQSRTDQLTTHDILCMAFQVARGMEYLASKKMVHRDLAARNILLTEDNTVKICDFGLAKHLYNEMVYKKKNSGPLPVKWMALESIGDRVFSSQSDVWSFGIVLWELFTLGETPYPGIEFDGEFFQKLVNGYRLRKPDYVTSDIYKVMTDCWKHEAKKRPTFSELVERIGSQIDENSKKYYVNLCAVKAVFEAASPADYTPLEPCQAEEKNNTGYANAEVLSNSRHLYLLESHHQQNDYMVMKSPTSRTFSQNETT